MTIREAATTVEFDVFDRRESHVRSYCRWFDAVLVSAVGSTVRDTTGREYLDFLAGAGALNYGHNDSDLKQALIRYLAADGITHGLDLFTQAKADFIEAFEQIILTPRGFDHRLQFTGPTGANAVEAALKLVRKMTGRQNVVAFTNAFHGVSMGALAATASAHHRMGPQLGLNGVTRMPFDGYLGADVDTAAVLGRMLADPSSGLDAPAAFLLETIQGEGGLNVASPDWLRRIAALAEQHGAALIIDDIQAGCGRTGTFFSFEGSGVTPDLVVLSKSLSGFGLPLSAVLVRPEWDGWKPGEHNGTFRGSAPAFVTAAAALRKFWTDDRLCLDVDRRSVLVRSRLAEIAAAVPGARVKGRGMAQGLDLRRGELAAAVRTECVRDGLLIECCGPHDEVLKVLAPLTTDDELLHRGLDVIQRAAARTTFRDVDLTAAEQPSAAVR